MDRGGLVGADGATHGGAFDITYMACLPNMVVMAPSNEAELIHMVATSAAIDDRPSCFRSALFLSDDQIHIHLLVATNTFDCHHVCTLMILHQHI